MVDEVDNGRDAQHLGETEPFYAVVLGLGLPVLDGLSVLRRWLWKGLARSLSPPASMPATCSCQPSRAVRMSTGIARPASSCWRACAPSSVAHRALLRR